MVVNGGMWNGDIQEMPITAPNLAITLRYQWMSQKMQTKRVYSVTGAAFLTATAVGVGEAFWNDVKTVWRAMTPLAGASVFKSVLVEELGGGSSFGEYAIPVGEQSGTRSTAGLTQEAPSFVNVGVRFTVGTRITRPGQMRVPFLWESDMDGQAVNSTFLTLVTALATKLAAPSTLGAPVATGVLTPQVVRFAAGSGVVIEDQQDVVGFVVNTNLTSQNTRKIGRGS